MRKGGGGLQTEEIQTGRSIGRIEESESTEAVYVDPRSPHLLNDRVTRGFFAE